MATRGHNGRNESGARDVINNTPNQGSFMSFPINAVADIVYFFTQSYVGLAVLSIGVVVAGVVALSLHWGDDDVCDARFRGKWRRWVLVLVLRNAIGTPTTLVRWRLSLQPPEERHRVLDQWSKSLAQLLEWLGFVQFIFGNVYLLQSRSCSNPWDSPMFQFSSAIIILTYVRHLLPSMVMCMLFPAAICCLPCVIRVLTVLQGQRQLEQGALREKIDGLPTVKYGETESTQDNVCVICLAAYVDDDELRKLPCDHAFHTSCTDSWLKINASCPICRTPCFEMSGEGEDRNVADGIFVENTSA